MEALRNYAGGGLTVILRHEFASPVTFGQATESVEKWYSLYMHMKEWSVVEGQTVSAGDVLGQVGLTGSTVSPHLHFEVRVGTRCSLEYALDNPGSSCNTLGVDPHVHPLLVLEAQPSSITQAVTQTYARNQDAIVRIETEDINPNVNQYLVQVTNGSVVRLSHLLDLNFREGFDASSTANLDSPDMSVPYLAPSLSVIPPIHGPLTWSFPPHGLERNSVVRNAWKSALSIFGATLPQGVP